MLGGVREADPPGAAFLEADLAQRLRAKPLAVNLMEDPPFFSSCHAPRAARVMRSPPDFAIHLVHEPEQTETGNKNDTRDNRARQSGLAMTFEKCLDRRREQPDLHHQQNHDERHSAVNSCQAPVLRRAGR